jgi:chemotaxis regulatin CheY-phosphate phosphatase CheZ
VKRPRRSEVSQETASRQAAVIRPMISDLERSIELLRIDISTEENRVRIFDKKDRLYPVLAKTLAARRENLTRTVATLARRLAKIEAPATSTAPEAGEHGVILSVAAELE